VENPAGFAVAHKTDLFPKICAVLISAKLREKMSSEQLRHWLRRTSFQHLSR